MKELEISDRFAWLSENNDQEGRLLDYLLPKARMHKGFNFKLGCYTPDKERVEAKVISVCGSLFTCEHPQTHVLFDTNVLEPYEALRFIEAYSAYEGLDYDPILVLMMMRVEKSKKNPVYTINSIKRFEDMMLSKRFPEWIDMPKDFDYTITGYCHDELGEYKVRSVCRDRFICSGNDYDDIFVMASKDRMPFEAMCFMNEFKHFTEQDDDIKTPEQDE